MIDENNESRVAWIAGIIEGEGYIGVRNGRPVIQVVMTDEDIIMRLLEWSEVGNITGPIPPREGQNLEKWKWSVTKRDDAAGLLKLLVPWLGYRRLEKALTVLSAYKESGPTKGTSTTCSYGHDISNGSYNLTMYFEHGYMKRRCKKCCARRTQESRDRKALL